jgi:uncharacterized membrane protein
VDRSRLEAFSDGVFAVAITLLALNSWDARLAMVLYAGIALGMSAGFGAIFEWTLHGQGRVHQPVPPEQHWAARRRFVGGAGVYLAAIVVALFNAPTAFLLIAAGAVYYIFERTPTSPGHAGLP